MESSQKPFQTFEDMEVYKSAREFRKAMYAVTRRLPSFEKYELASQIRRASVSLTNNIAEGHGRWHFLDHIKFLLQGRGSLEELLDDLNVCEDEKYLPIPDVMGLKESGYHVRKLINGYLRYLRDRKTGSSFMLHEDSIPYGDTDEELELWLASLDFEPN
jgi:four helix bundle protein